MSFENPYIAGSSVGGTPAFIGRNDILRDVQQVLRHSKENAILLYGQRRIGKTSVLQELEAKLPQEGAYHPIFFDLLGKAHQSLEEVLHELADTISEALGKGKANLGNDPKTKFRHVWLPNLLNQLDTKSLVLLFDEFDVLDDSASSKQTSNDFFHYLRELLTTSNSKRLYFVFVIGRNIDDMNNIALAFFKGIRTKRVSLLEHDDTVKLIRLSVENKSLQWSKEVIEQVWELTNGHPYLTQCLCSHVWENLYDDEPNDPPIVTSKNIEAVIPKTLESSLSALEWLWGGLPPAERIVISALAGAGAKAVISAEQLKELLYKSGVQVVLSELETAPKLLQEWDLIEPVQKEHPENGYRLRVELLRRWIAEKKPLTQVQRELDRIEPVAEGYYQEGKTSYSNNKLTEALESLRLAIKKNPNHVGANQLLADILRVQGHLIEAHKILEWLYKYQPGAAYDRLIQILLDLAAQKGKQHKWITALPQPVSVLLTLFSFSFFPSSTDVEDEQIKLYEQVLELEHNHRKAKSEWKEIWQRRGDNAHKKGNLSDALKAYHNAGLDNEVAKIIEEIKTQVQLPKWYQRLAVWRGLLIALVLIVGTVISEIQQLKNEKRQFKNEVTTLQKKKKNCSMERKWFSDLIVKQKTEIEKLSRYYSPPPPPPSECFPKYTIQKNDSFIKIAKKCYNDEACWTLIRDNNPNIKKNPKKFQPKVVLKMPEKGEKECIYENP
jgi:tetratricopeptide (TPR) repeat protein